jgi:hypothetical protein
MGFWKIWALLVIALVIIGWMRGKHFLAFSTAGFVGLGGLMVLDRAGEADQPSNYIFLAGLFVTVALSTLSLIANHLRSS